MRPTLFSLENLKWLITTLAIPLALAWVSHEYQTAQTERQDNEAKLRLYTELLSKREEADTGVRKGIFDKVIETFLKPGAKDLEAKLVALELLALNFNDSLDLSPLFWQIDREIRQPAQAEKRNDLLKQLDRITNEVKDRQAEVLAVVGANKDAKIEFSELNQGGPPLIDDDLTFPDPDSSAPKNRTRHFTVEVAEHDAAGRRVLVFVTHRGTNANEKDKLWAFWVDMFDFPLTNFTRISKSERFAVVLKRYSPQPGLEPPAGADLTLLYFPASRSGVKDKPFIDEVVSNLKPK